MFLLAGCFWLLNFQVRKVYNALDEVLGGNHDWWTLRGSAALAAKQDFLFAVAVHLRRAGIDPAQVHI